MSDERKKWTWRHAVWATPFALLAIYVSGYFLLGDVSYRGDVVLREYPSPAVARAYRPLMYLECKIRGCGVVLVYRTSK